MRNLKTINGRKRKANIQKVMWGVLRYSFTKVDGRGKDADIYEPETTDVGYCCCGPDEEGFVLHDTKKEAESWIKGREDRVLYKVTIEVRE